MVAQRDRKAPRDHGSHTARWQRTWLALGCGAANHKLRRGIALSIATALQLVACCKMSKSHCSASHEQRRKRAHNVARTLEQAAPQAPPPRGGRGGGQGPPPPGWTHTIGGGGGWGRRATGTYIYIYIHTYIYIYIYIYILCQTWNNQPGKEITLFSHPID